MYSDTFPPAAFGVETNGKGGFIPGGGFGGFTHEADGNAIPSIYNPYMASSADTHTRKCLPLNITMIYRAYNENPGARVLLNGEEVGHFKLVGRVTNFFSNKDGGAEKFSFDLVDDAGIIKVEWLVSYTAEGNSPWLQQRYNDFENRATQRPLESFYVKVFGECNLRGIHEPRVKANAVHLVTSPYEVEGHKQDVSIAHLSQPGSAMAAKYCQIKHDPQVLSEVRSFTASATISPSLPQAPVNTNRFSVLQPPPSPARVSEPPPPKVIGVREKVHQFLLEMRETHPNGVHVKIIAHNAGTDVEEVREVLKDLEEAGDAYYKKSEDWWTAI